MGSYTAILRLDDNEGPSTIPTRLVRVVVFLLHSRVSVVSDELSPKTRDQAVATRAIVATVQGLRRWSSFGVAFRAHPSAALSKR